jgi:hypothetical protein
MEKQTIPKKIPSWPNERDLNRYAEMTLIDFKNELAKDKVWIDIGCRTGKALSQIRKHFDAKLVGINAHKIRVRKGIESYYSLIPDDRRIYENYQQKADLVTDIYGSVSYSENPLEAMIYAACLLKPQAKAVFITLETRMGNLQKIKNFFHTVMKQEIKFQRFTTYSDNTKTPIKTLRVTILGHCRSRINLEGLFKKAQRDVGIMKKAKMIWQSADLSAEQWRVIFVPEKRRK